MSQEESTSAAAAAQQPTSRPASKLNERIMSSLSRRAVAAHPWHDLQIVEFAMEWALPEVYSYAM